MERLRIRKRKVILVLGAAFLVLFYVTPVYHSVRSGSPTPFGQIGVQNYSLESSMSLIKRLCFNFRCLPSMWGGGESTRYLVDTSECKIVDMDPFDSSVTKFLDRNTKPMKCKKPLVRLDNQTLRLDKKQIKNWKYANSTCCYRELNRVAQSPTNYNKNADWVVSLSNKCHPISVEGTPVSAQYIKIECKDEDDVKANIDFLTVPLPPSQQSKLTETKAQKWDSRRRQGEEIPPSVLIIGIDSISRLHMKRQLPRTGEYLERHDFIEMTGYTKIGENTFPNMMGILGGMSPWHYPCYPNRDAKVDDCPLIWKNFSDKGYLTAWLEDAPGIATFNYEKTGFVNVPTDYYLRPLMVASHLEEKRARTSGVVSCFQGLSPTDYMAKYIQRLIEFHGSQYPFFFLSWFTSIGHDEFNGLQNADDTFRQLLKEAVENPAYGGNNTVILFVSDHGYRFGAFRETFLGFYEESLPFFFIRIPPSLKARYPHWYRNLKVNSQRLTTPLDFHETLKDILNLPVRNISVPNSVLSANSSDVNYPHRDPAFRDRYSFFEDAPINRTCESSRIPQSYCMCGVSPEIGKTSGISTELAQFALFHLNSKILKSSINEGICVGLSFSKVLYGRESGRGEVLNDFEVLIPYQDYVIAMESIPGKAHFEARVRVFPNATLELTDSVNRINSYQGQSDCTRDYELKKYCMCRDVAEREEAAKKAKTKKG